GNEAVAAFAPNRTNNMVNAFQSLALFGARTHLAHNRFILGSRNLAPFGQLVFCFGDIGYANNQSISYQLHTLPIHVALAASTLRAAENRIAEAHTYPAFSLLSAAYGANNTINNHA